MIRIFEMRLRAEGGTPLIRGLVSKEYSKK